MPRNQVKIYSRVSRLSKSPGGYFHLEEEKTRTCVFGYGHGDHIKLTDEYGNNWRGTAERNSDNSVVYRFRDHNGNSLSGVSSGDVVTLRDQKGSIWKGFVG
jgi:hypothetical protein